MFKRFFVYKTTKLPEIVLRKYNVKNEFFSFFFQYDLIIKYALIIIF